MELSLVHAPHPTHVLPSTVVENLHWPARMVVCVPMWGTDGDWAVASSVHSAVAATRFSCLGLRGWVLALFHKYHRFSQ